MFIFPLNYLTISGIHQIYLKNNLNLVKRTRISRNFTTIFGTTAISGGKGENEGLETKGV